MSIIYDEPFDFLFIDTNVIRGMCSNDELRFNLIEIANKNKLTLATSLANLFEICDFKDILQSLSDLLASGLKLAVICSVKTKIKELKNFSSTDYSYIIITNEIVEAHNVKVTDKSQTIINLLLQSDEAKTVIKNKIEEFKGIQSILNFVNRKLCNGAKMTNILYRLSEQHIIKNCCAGPDIYISDRIQFYTIVDRLITNKIKKDIPVNDIIDTMWSSHAIICKAIICENRQAEVIKKLKKLDGGLEYLKIDTLGSINTLDTIS